MKNARAERAKLLFLPTKYANFVTFLLPSPLYLLKLPTVMTTGTVCAKMTTMIGFWNVPTMYEQGRMAQVIAEMKRYKLAILDIVRVDGQDLRE